MNTNLKTEPGYQNVLDLIDLFLTLLASSAEGKRGFSAMGRVKNRLAQPTPGHPFARLVNGYPRNFGVTRFDPKAAVSRWMSRNTSIRCPDFTVKNE